MKEWKQSLLRIQEDGMEAIEGLLVITLTLFVLFSSGVMDFYCSSSLW